MIEVKNISFAYSSKPIFNKLSFKLDSNRHSAIHAPSGSGKTTLMQIMLGFLRPSDGEVIYENQVLASDTVNEIRNEISWVPQNVNLPFDTVADLMEAMQVDFTEVLGICKKMNLRDVSQTTKFNEMSIGQKQRLVIAVAIAQHTLFLFLDEPTAALDEDAITALLEIIDELRSTTVVSISHNADWLKSASKVINL